MANIRRAHLKNIFGVLCGALLLVMLLSGQVHAANPATVSFQGKVVNSNGTNVTNGTYSFVFKLYSVASGGTALWTETDSLTVSGGIFQVNLGAVCPFFTANACNSSTPIDFNANPALYLGVTFNADPAGEMSPRVQLQSVPYAYNADKVGGISGSQIVQLSPSAQQTGNINISGTATAATSVVTPTLTASGALAINSGGATNVTIDSGATGGTLSLGATNAAAVSVSRAGQITTINGGLVVNQTATLNGTVTMTFNGTENLAITSDLAGNVNGISFVGTPSATAGATNGAFIQQANSANTNGLDNGLVIDNADTDLPIGSAISISNSGGGGYTNIITSPNFTLDSNAQIFAKGYDYFDPSLLGGVSNLGSGGTTGGNFGGIASTGAFISNTDMYAQEFVASLTSATTNNRNVGDSTNWYFNNNGQTQTSSSTISTQGGYFRITNGNTTGRGGLLAEGATPGTLDKPLNAANLPVMQMKVRPSIVRITDDFVWGMADTATAPVTNNRLPTNGIFFWTNNSTGAGGWQGVVRSGNATVGTVVCPGGIGTNFATGRIVVVDATTVRFYIDTDATDGIDFVDCGTVTGALPTADLSLEMYVIHTINNASTFDMDYARFWQDDAAPANSATASSILAAEIAQANASEDSVGLETPSLDAPVTEPEPPVIADSEPGSQTLPPETSSSGPSYAIDQSTNLNLASATISGGLSVGGDSTFSGLSTFEKLATFIGKVVFRQNVEFQGHVIVASDTAGYAQLKQGESTVHVTFKQVYDNPPIVSATAYDGQYVIVSISHVTATGFDVTVAAPVTQDTTFAWTAVGVNAPVTSSNTPADVQ